MMANQNSDRHDRARAALHEGEPSFREEIERYVATDRFTETVDEYEEDNWETLEEAIKEDFAYWLGD